MDFQLNPLLIAVVLHFGNIFDFEATLPFGLITLALVRGILWLFVTAMKKMTVLLGGWSSEREVSILSGKNVSKTLKGMGYEVTEIDVKKDLRYLVDELYKSSPDFIFNSLHGSGGEDGIVQGILEMFGVPYSGSNVLSSAICFDKAVCKELVRSKGVRTVEGFETTPQNIKSIKDQIDYPFVVKPASDGSSVGLSIIFNDEDWRKFINTDWTFGNKIIVEKYISGREFTVGVLDGKAIGAIEITFKRKAYDYTSKYKLGASEHVANYSMDERSSRELLQMAEIAFKTCGCSGIARIDFRYDGEKVYFLEINTQPGTTELSLVPDIAKFAGIKLEELLQKIIDSAINFQK